MTAEGTIKAIKKELRSFCERCEDSCRNYGCNDCIIAIAYEKATEALVLVKQQQTEIKREQSARQKQAEHLVELQGQKYELMNRISVIKNEAYKEFADRIRQVIVLNNTHDGYLVHDIDYNCLMEDIDDVLKELVGEDR